MSNGVVGVNLLWLVSGVVGGSEEYTVRLLRAIDRLDPDDIELKLYAQPSLTVTYPDLLSRFEVINSSPVLASKLVRIGAEATWLRRRSGEDDLLHHAGSAVLPTKGRPYVFTVHNLQPLDMPENFSPVKRRWLATLLPPSILNAELVLCPSEFVAGTIEEHFGLARDRIRVVPHGHEAIVPGVIDEDEDARLRETYGRYVLLPAIAYVHKRHRDLVDALAILADEHPDLNLVFTGGSGPESEAVAERADDLGLGDRVHRLGRVPESELDALYRSASVMAFPSLYEGFGNPALEAMVRGCPVVATSSASIPEVVGDAGVLVEPQNPEALAAGIRRVLEEPGLADALRAAGLVRAEEFGWEQAGAALLGAYRDALS